MPKRKIKKIKKIKKLSVEVLNDFVKADGFDESLRALGVEPSVSEPVGITLKCAGRNFAAVGDTLEDALNKIKISGGTRILSVLTVQQGDRKRTKILNASLTNRLFGHVSNTAKIIAFKQIKQIFP